VAAEACSLTDLRQAKNEIDEATALDFDGEYLAWIQRVRGKIFYCEKDYNRAIAAFDLALSKTPLREQPHLLLCKSLSLERLGKIRESHDAAMEGLSTTRGPTGGTRKMLAKQVANTIILLDMEVTRAANVPGERQRTAQEPMPHLGQPQTAFVRRLASLRGLPVNDVETLNKAGEYGWHSIKAVSSQSRVSGNQRSWTHTLESSNEQWEHCITLVFSKTPANEGWTRVNAPSWFGIALWARPMGAPAIPGQPDPEAFLMR